MGELFIVLVGAVVAFAVQVAFWLSVIFGALWCLNHFGVI